MRGLLKTLAPFAPDQSGVVSALYGLDGLLVICDAGGCTGNICGFDEPRWFAGEDGNRNAIFSAGLRDMDAILGRDELLVEKLADAAAHLNASFAALIGTPVPAVIATDFDALRTLAEEKTGLPVLTFPCTGTRRYDEGEREAYLELFRTFAGVPASGEDDPTGGTAPIEVAQATQSDARGAMLGVLGCTPLDISRTEVGPAIDRYAKEHGFSRAFCYGMGAGLSEVRRAGSVKQNLVVAPAGIAAAEYLWETFGIPYEVDYPFLGEAFLATLRSLFADGAKAEASGRADDGTAKAHPFGGKRILIVHQQVAANAIRKILRGISRDGTRSAARDEGCRDGMSPAPGDDENCDADIVCGTWFLQIPALAEAGDVTFFEEAQFSSYVEEGRYDIVIGDSRFRRALPYFDGEFIACPHFAVSGRLEDT